MNNIFIVSIMEPVSVLKNEFFWVRLDARARALLSVLNIEFLSVILDVEAIEPLKLLIHVLASDPAMVREPLRL